MVIGIALECIKHVVGYLYPAYLTYKAMRQPRDDDMHRWIVYWTAVACFTTVEFLGDLILYWVPLYRLGKILFMVYLWHPMTQGAEWVYSQAVIPVFQQNEKRIDEGLEEANVWLQEKFYIWKEQAVIVIYRAGAMILEKAKAASPQPIHVTPGSLSDNNTKRSTNKRHLH